jgi:hypothetical protein
MEHSDQSLASKLVLGLGTLVVVSYSVATASSLLSGHVGAAIQWLAVLVAGLAVGVSAAATVEHCASRK